MLLKMHVRRLKFIVNTHYIYSKSNTPICFSKRAHKFSLIVVELLTSKENTMRDIEKNVFSRCGIVLFLCWWICISSCDRACLQWNCCEVRVCRELTGTGHLLQKVLKFIWTIWEDSTDVRETQLISCVFWMTIKEKARNSQSIYLKHLW